MDIALAVVIAANVWEKALAASLWSLTIAIVVGIIRIIKRATLGSEFKDLEKVLDKFGSTNNIEFDITNGEEKLLKSFSPKQLSEFIRMKYQERKQWKNKELELYHKVLENNNISEPCSRDTKDICYKGLYIKSPMNWSFDNSENKSFPIITCYDGNDNSITVFVDERYISIEDCVERNIWKIKASRNKFIRSTPTNRTINGYPTCSVGYAYKYADYNRYGIVIGYPVADNLAAILHITCKKDWSFLCSDLITTIIDSVKYDR
jgi:hypothetical protein